MVSDSIPFHTRLISKPFPVHPFSLHKDRITGLRYLGYNVPNHCDGLDQVLDTHPCILLSSARVTSKEDTLCLAEFEKGRKPLSELLLAGLDQAAVASICTDLLSAYHYLSLRGLSLPNHHLGCFLFKHGYPLQLAGCEFGIAHDRRGRPDQTRTYDLRYTAPEIQSGHNSGEKGDVFAACSMVYHFVQGKAFNPHRGDDHHADVAGLIQILKSGLHPNPRQRSRFRDISHALSEAGIQSNRWRTPIKEEWTGPTAKGTPIEINQLGILRTTRRLIAEGTGSLVLHHGRNTSSIESNTLINDLESQLKAWLHSKGIRNVGERLDAAQTHSNLNYDWMYLKNLCEYVLETKTKEIIFILEGCEYFTESEWNTFLNFRKVCPLKSRLILLTERPLHRRCREFLSEDLQELNTNEKKIDKDELQSMLSEPHCWTDSSLESAVCNTFANKRPFLYKCIRHACKSTAQSSPALVQLDDLNGEEQQILRILSISAIPIESKSIETLTKSNSVKPALHLLEKVGLIDSLENRLYSIKNIAIASQVQKPLLQRTIHSIAESLLFIEEQKQEPSLLQKLYLSTRLNKGRPPQHLLKQFKNETFEEAKFKPLKAIHDLLSFRANSSLQPLADWHLTLSGHVTTKTHKGYHIGPFARALSRYNEGRLKDALKIYDETSRKRTLPKGLKRLAMTKVLEICLALNLKVEAGKQGRRFFRTLEVPYLQEEAQAQAARVEAALHLIGRGPLTGMVKGQYEAWPRGAGAYAKGNYQNAVEIWQSFIPRAEESQDLLFRSLFWKYLGNANYRINNSEKARSCYLRALRYAEEIGSESDRYDISYNLAHVENLSARFQSAQGRFEKLLQQTRKKKDRQNEIHILYGLALGDLMLNDSQAFAQNLERLFSLCTLVGEKEGRLRGLALKLHTALIMPTEELKEDLESMEKLQEECEIDPVLHGEVEAASAIARWSLFGEVPENGGHSPFVQWRLRFLRALSGISESTPHGLLSDIGENFFRSLHLYLVHTALLRNLAPSSWYCLELEALFDEEIQRTGARYLHLKSRHFKPNQEDRTVAVKDLKPIAKLIEKIQPYQTLERIYRNQAFDILDNILSFDSWGLGKKENKQWTLIDGNHENSLTNLFGHLDYLGEDLPLSPLATTWFNPKIEQEQSLLIFPQKQNEVLWFCLKQSPDHLDEGTDMLLRLLGKVISFALPSDQQRSQSIARKNTIHLIGTSNHTSRLRQQIQSLASSELNLFISGESGTGKELVAKALHECSLRKEAPFAAINCSAYPENLVEAHLFGHAAGAFTGAGHDRAGLLETTDGGTLFLDETGDLSAKVQSLLLRVFQEGEFTRLGETKIRKVDIRYLTATNKNITEMIRAGRFREDLYFRMAEETISLKPLRERREDIRDLVLHFAQKHAPNRKVHFSEDFFEMLHGYTWPGNIRELESYIKKILALFPRVTLMTSQRVSSPNKHETLVYKQDLSLSAFEHQNRVRFIRERLLKYNGNRTKAAKSLGISRQQLVNLIRQLDIKSKSPKGNS